MANLKQTLATLLPGVKTYFVARRSLAKARMPHFRPIQSWWTPTPETLADRPPSETAAVNACSEKYFEHAENRESWLNRPFSHPETVGKNLERFGLLLETLDIRPGDRVLDFGCGAGWTSKMLARMGAHVIALDIAPAALDIARESAERELTPEIRSRLEFRTYSGDAIDIGDGEIDFVVVFDAFHHFPNPKTILAEFHRVLSHQGRFGFAEPGVGHSEAESSIAETAHGILEEDLDLEQFYQSGRAAGFRGLELAVPSIEPEVLTLPMDRMRRFLRGLWWNMPQDFLRNAVLTGPIGAFRKGRYPVTSLNPRSHLAQITPVAVDLSARASEAIQVKARVLNRSDTVWLREGRRGRGYVRLGAHLLDATDAIVNHDYGRGALPSDVGKDDVADVTLNLDAPAEPGTYTIRLDMVNEGMCWFAQHGSAIADVRLDVTSPER